ncbi:hypothetical protein H310_04222 [Aphanomyces invadans]|uniref:Tc1-like transposase DDE domain-containing protein n=1 Tax=Aphanomyces invadans TaxID=157072 RepID=A0A024UI08_9STRA|nr:hypothetical protein H310_04222 [Aphanomyces invadans]ETW05258.1 hypothetical protein H310_04222 [Aphanomyces invadans]|eukprot:XP_008866696.1 hypothetical protein H310_04222 [Aphanomyces invadans]
MLTDKHKAERLGFVKSFLRRGHGDTVHWHDMLDTVHIDEKWFYISKVNRRYYLWNDEPVPMRKCQSKRHLMKVMFLTAVARPRFDAHRRKSWDGKIGTWPFTMVRPALRNSKNFKRGDAITEPVVVTKEVYRSFLVDKVIPAIKSRWPGRRSKTIWVQQDSARPHVAVDDAPVLAAGQSDGWDIRLCAQPSQSPDMNVLDLGLFNAIQSLQHHTASYTIEELVLAVSKAYDDLDPLVLDKTFMTLQKVMECVLKMDGDNVYKIPHANKDKLLKNGPLCQRVQCDEETYAAIEAMEERIDFVQSVDNVIQQFQSTCEIHDSMI